MRKPTRELRLVPMDDDKIQKYGAVVGDTEVLSDTEKHAQLMLKIMVKMLRGFGIVILIALVY